MITGKRGIMSAVAKKTTGEKKVAKKAAVKKTAVKKVAAPKKATAAKKAPAKKASDAKVAPKAKAPRLPSALTAIKKALKTKKGEDVKVLDVRGISPVTDYLVLCTGRTLPHLDALANETIRVLRAGKPPRAPHKRAGARQTEWVVLDYIDIVVHLFTPEFRSYYALEDLWKDAPMV